MKDWFSARDLLSNNEVRNRHELKFEELRRKLFELSGNISSIDTTFQIRSKERLFGVSITCSPVDVVAQLGNFINEKGSAIVNELGFTWNHERNRRKDGHSCKLNSKVTDHELNRVVLDSPGTPLIGEFKDWNKILFGKKGGEEPLAHYSSRANLALDLHHFSSNETESPKLIVAVFITAWSKIACIDKIKKEVHDYCASEAVHILTEIAQHHHTEVERQSRAAAISQVLARTLSHNLGSHSLNRFSRPTELKKVVEDLYFECAKKPPKEWLPGRILGAPVQSMGPTISAQRDEWIAYYNNYLRERMDFLADITTAVPAFEAKTHLVGDLLTGYANNVLLATTIAGDEKFDYQWVTDLGDAEDLLVSIPADVLGRHAFYIILENIVRNSAKHGQHGFHTVDYTVKVEPIETHPGYLKVTILDNHPSRTTDEARQRAAEANGNINATVLGDDGRVRSNAWGMLEMKACAAYLRRVALEDLDEAKYRARMLPPGSNELPQLSKTDEPPLLEAVSEGNRLGYTFYLQRPKDVMVVGSDRESVFGATQGAVLDQHGVGFMSADAIQENKVIQHALLVVDARDTAVFNAFLHRVKADMNSLPHEILLIQGTDNDVQHAKGKLAQSLNGLECATVLLDSVWYISEDEWSKIICSSPTDIYTALRQRWQVEWMKDNGYKVNNATTSFRNYGMLISHETRAGEMVANAIYVEHGDFYGNVHDRLERIQDMLKSKFPEISPEALGAMPDLTPVVLVCREHKALPIVQCYPGALTKVMQPSQTETAMSISEWAQHHFSSWLKGVAVLDERVQRCAETDHFTPRQDGPALPVVVKHLLAMGQVFVPPADTLGLERDLTHEKWIELMKWIRSFRKGLRYVCVHLTILEKFARSVKADNGAYASMEQLVSYIRRENPNVRIIIVSGRGQPGNLPKGELFMSYSALSQYTTQTYQRAPVLLNMLCHAARRLN